MTLPRLAAPLSSPGLRRRLSHLAGDPAVRRAVTIVVGLRVGLGIAAWVGLLLAPPAMIAGRQLPAPSGGLTSALIDPWQRWDSWHYEAVATAGYPRGTFDVAFLPLYPLLMRAAGVAVGGSVALGGLLVSTLAAIVALALLHRLVAADLGEAIARRTVLYLGVAPTAMFLMAPYSESVFLALSAGALLAVRSRRPLAAGVLIGAAALTRPQGLLLLVPALVEMAPELRHGWRRLQARQVVGVLMLPALPVVAFTGWLLWTRNQVGITTLSAEQGGWGSHAAWPWQGLVDGLANRAAYPGPLYNSVTVAAWTALVVVLIRHQARVPPSYIAYAAVSLVPVVFREEGFGNPWASAPRFALVVFPLFAGLALVTERRPRLHVAWTAVSAVLGLIAVLVFSHNQFVA